MQKYSPSKSLLAFVMLNPNPEAESCGPSTVINSVAVTPGMAVLYHSIPMMFAAGGQLSWAVSVLPARMAAKFLSKVQIKFTKLEIRSNRVLQLLDVSLKLFVRVCILQ